MAYTLTHFGTSGSTYYAKPCPLVVSPWDGDDVALVENGTTGEFSATIVSPADVYAVYLQAGGSPASTDIVFGMANFTEEKLANGVKAKTDLIPASPAAVSDIPTASANAAAAAAAILATPANLLTTDAQGRVTTSNPAQGAKTVNIGGQEVVIS